MHSETPNPRLSPHELYPTKTADATAETLAIDHHVFHPPPSPSCSSSGAACGMPWCSNSDRPTVIRPEAKYEMLISKLRGILRSRELPVLRGTIHMIRATGHPDFCLEVLVGSPEVTPRCTGVIQYQAALFFSSSRQRIAVPRIYVASEHPGMF